MVSERLRDMKCTAHNLEVMGLNPSWVELGGAKSKLYLNQKYLSCGPIAVGSEIGAYYVNDHSGGIRQKYNI